MAFFPISPIPYAGGNFLASMQTYMFAWCALTPTKIMIAYYQNAPMKLYVQIVNFNGSNPPTMGPVTYVADVVGTLPNNSVLKLDAFNSTTVGLLWNQNPNGSNTPYNVSILNVDASDNITWNKPVMYVANTFNYGNNGCIFKCSGPTEATTTCIYPSNLEIRRVIRNTNTVTITSNTVTVSSSTGVIYSRRLPTAGLAHIHSTNVGANPTIYFTNNLSAPVAISGVSGVAPGPCIISAVSDNLLHYFRNAGTASINARPLNLNLGAGTGNWLTGAELNYNISNWPTGTLLDVVQIDSEYFMIMTSTAAMADPSTFVPVVYSFVIGRYNTSTASYVFAPVRYNAPTLGIPMWGLRHLHLINSNTVACFCIQGTDTNRVLGVKLLYL